MISFVLLQNQSVVKDPRLYRHKVGDEGRYLAFNNGRVPLNYVFVLGLRYVKLGYHCKIKYRGWDEIAGLLDNTLKITIEFNVYEP